MTPEESPANEQKEKREEDDRSSPPAPPAPRGIVPASFVPGPLPGDNGVLPPGRAEKPFSPEDRRSARLAIIGGAVARASFQLSRGAILVGFLIHMGLDDFYPLLAATVFLGAFPEILIPMLLERTGRRRRLFFLTRGPLRLIWLGVAATPFFIAPEETTVRFVFIFVFLLLHHANRAGGDTLFLSWSGDLVPEGRRGRFFGAVEGLGSLFWVVLAVPAAYIVGHFEQMSRTADGDLISGEYRLLVTYVYATVFVLSVLFSMTEIVIFHFVRHPAYRKPKRLITFRALAEPFRLASFRRLILGFGVWQFGNMLMWGMIPVLMKSSKFFNMKLSTMQWIWVVASLASFAGGMLWGRLGDRWGYRRTLLAALPLQALASVMYLFASRDWYILPVIAGFTFGSFTLSGIMAIQRALLLKLTGREMKSIAFGVFDIVIGIASAAAMALAWLVLWNFADIWVPFISWDISVLQEIIAAGAIFRLAAALLAGRLLPRDGPGDGPGNGPGDASQVPRDASGEAALDERRTSG